MELHFRWIFLRVGHQLHRSGVLLAGLKNAVWRQSSHSSLANRLIFGVVDFFPKVFWMFYDVFGCFWMFYDVL